MEHFRPVLRRSWDDSWALFFAAPVWTIVLAILVWALSTLLQWRNLGALLAAVSSLFYTLLATVIVFTALFVLHFFYLTPKRMVAEADGRLREAEDRAETLSIAHKQRVEAIESELAQARASAKADQNAQREKRRRKELANKLALVMDNGRELASRCADQDASAHPSEEEIGLWTDSVYAELAINGLGLSTIYIARYNAARDMSGTAIVGIHLDRSRDYKFIMSKVDVLGEFIKELMQTS